MLPAGVVRALCLFAPGVAALLLWLWRRPDRRRAAGALLAFAWNLPALLLVHALAGRFGWWRFEAEGGTFLGFPVDLFLGWAVLWSIVPALAFPRAPLPATLAFLLLLDLSFMPLGASVVHLDPAWLTGETVALALVLVPAQLLSRWTAEHRRLRERAALQVVLFSGLLLGLLPALILEMTGGSWNALLSRPAWWRGLGLQLVALPALLGLSAVQEFVERGRGTPIPYDPPETLVTTGIYAYVANPMQISTSIVLVLWGILLGSVWVASAGVMAVLYGAGLADWHESEALRQRFGEPWARYRRCVRRWLPRLRPGWNGPPARLYVAMSCGPCFEVARFFKRRRPVGLDIASAEHHPLRDLSRITYEPGDGSPDAQGIAAVARALEHVHLGWALIGFALRLPLVRPAAQVLVDAVGGGPHVTRRVSPS